MQGSNVPITEVNFRNQKIVRDMDLEYRKMFRAYHKYLSLRKKLLGLKPDKDELEAMTQADIKFCQCICLANSRIEKEDFEDAMEFAYEV